LHDEVVLAVVDEHGHALVEQLFDQVYLVFHEVSVQLLVDLVRSAVVHHFGVELVDVSEDGFVAEVGLKQLCIGSLLPS
jgi:hypothetical protein